MDTSSVEPQAQPHSQIHTFVHLLGLKQKLETPSLPPVRELAYGNSFILEATTTSSTSLQHVTAAAVCQCCHDAFVSGRLHSLTFSLATLFLSLFVFVIDIDFVIFFLSFCWWINGNKSLLLHFGAESFTVVADGFTFTTGSSESCCQSVCLSPV